MTGKIEKCETCGSDIRQARPDIDNVSIWITSALFGSLSWGFEVHPGFIVASMIVGAIAGAALAQAAESARTKRHAERKGDACAK